MKRKPPGYWQDWNNIERELQEVIDTEYKDSDGNVIKAKGEFPNNTQLLLIGKKSLRSSLKYHGHFNDIKTRMGFTPSRKPPGYWQDWNNFERELQEVIDTEYEDNEGNVIKAKGEFPTTTDLEKIERHDIINAMYRHKLGINSAMEMMGFKPLKKPPGYWQDWNNIERELQEVIDTEYKDNEGNVIKAKGEFPSTTKFLNIIGKKSLKNAVRSYQTEVNNIKKSMGFKPLKKPPGYWKDWNIIKRELREVIDKEYKDSEGNVIKAKGEFPSATDLKKIERHDIINAMHRHKLGIYSAMEMMGFKSNRKPRGYWQDWNNFERELQEVIYTEYKDNEGNVIKAKGEFPTRKKLIEIGKSSIASSFRYHGEHYELMEMMGFSSNKKPPGYWQDWNNFERELREVIDTEYKDKDGSMIKASGEFPAKQILINFSINGLSFAFKYHGGFPAVRQRMGFPVNGAIKSPRQFSELIKTDDDARYILERFGGSEADVADILAVVYEGRLGREQALEFLQEPGLSDYLGEFQRPIDGIPDIVEMSEKLLPYDKDNIIYQIVLNRAMEYRDSILGAKPEKGKIDSFLKDLEMGLGVYE
jgi:uncharacterized Zn ribbon protein